MKYKVGDIVFSTIWKKSVLIKDLRLNRFYLIADLEYLSRTMVTHESNLKSREDDIEKDMEEHQKIVDEIMAIQGIEPIEAEMEEVWHCPEGYVFKDENGNVINATKIVLEKKKKEYPKTYEECLPVLEIYNRFPDVEVYNAKPSECKLFESFIRLKRCRDAYWKIAGEKMGLGKPWEPNDNNKEPIHAITRYDGYIIKDESGGNDEVLEFPTAEMRDDFYENFKELIETVKELL